MSCRYEADVLRAAGDDRWTDTLRNHLTECDDCIAAAAVAPWMTRFARMSDRTHILPDPQVVWLKARLLQGAADVARISRPMNIVQMIAYLAVAAGWIGLLTWKWNVVQGWIQGLTPVGIVENVAATPSMSASFVTLLLGLGSMTVMLAMHTIMAEE